MLKEKWQGKKGQIVQRNFIVFGNAFGNSSRKPPAHYACLGSYWSEVYRADKKNFRTVNIACYFGSPNTPDIKVDLLEKNPKKPHAFIYI